MGFLMKKTKTVLDNPVYIGFCVLDLAKLEMQQFHYDVIKKQEWQANLLYTDTDSLIYEIYCDIFDKRVQINKYETLPYGHKDTL